MENQNEEIIDNGVNHDIADDFIKDFEKTAEHTSIGSETKEIINEPETGNNVSANEPGKKKSLSKLVNPKFAINIIDLIIPTLLVFVLDRAGYQVEKSKLQLDKDEKETLKPFVDDFLENVQINFDNPYINLCVGLGIVYGIRTIDVIPEMSKISSEFKEIEESNAVKFEKEFNKQIERVMKEKKKKTVNSAKKYFIEQEPALFKNLLEQFEISQDEFDELYNNNDNDFKL